MPENASCVLCATVNRTCEATGLSREVEFEIQIEQVFECLACNLADCALANIGEDRVQHFAKERSTNTSSAVCVGVTTV